MAVENWFVVNEKSGKSEGICFILMGGHPGVMLHILCTSVDFCCLV